MNAGGTLLKLRKYPAGLELLRAGQRLSDAPEYRAQIDRVAPMKRYEDISFAPDDPRGPVMKFLQIAFASKAEAAQIQPLIDKNDRVENWTPVLQALWLRNAGLISLIRREFSNGDSVMDAILSTIEMNKEGNAQDGWRVEVHSRFAAGLPSFFVVRQGSECRLIAAAGNLASIGVLARRALAKGDLATAQRWLDLAKKDARPGAEENERGPAFRYLWSGVAPETRNREFVEIAAASLIGTYSSSAEAIAILKRAEAKPPQYADQAEISFALCEALAKAERWTEPKPPRLPFRNSGSIHLTARALRCWPKRICTNGRPY
jgi:hypothetical protein